MAHKPTSAWRWLIPILLLITGLSAHSLDIDGLWHDEIWSYYVAGGAHYGPLPLSKVWERVATEDPTQGMGYPPVLAGWGALVGWTPYAARALSLLVGVLAVAMVYRLGREVVSHRTGMYAAALLSVSAFYIYYLHEVRAYAPVVLFGALLLWSYWRILTRAKSGWLISCGLVMGGAGLLYTNYYTAVLLLALALYHLLFVPKTRRWWKPVILALVVGLLFIPALQAFLRGYGRYTAWSDIRAVALTPPQLTEQIWRYMANGQTALFIIMAACALWVASRYAPGSDEKRGTRFMLFLAVAGMIIAVLMNTVMQVIDNTRVRYVLTLWIPAMICLGAGLDGLMHYRKTGRAVATGLLMLWLAGGISANFNPDFLRDITGGTRLRWQTMTDILYGEGLPEDVFAFYAGDYNWDAWFTFDFAMHSLPFPAFVTFTPLDEPNQAWAYSTLENARRVWYGLDPMKPVTTTAYETMQTILDSEFVLCRDDVLIRPDMRLMLYARSAAFCPNTPPEIVFGEKIALNVDLSQGDSRLTLNIGVAPAPDLPSETYSLAVHLMDAAGKLAAQQDTGLPGGHFVTMQPQLSLTELPAGTYRVYLIVYNWQTGERLNGTHLQTQETGDRIRVGEVELYR